jgi:predicted hotdog family 3-hydroxylacyl-ACP dehydratase
VAANNAAVPIRTRHIRMVRSRAGVGEYQCEIRTEREARPNTQKKKLVNAAARSLL